MESLILSLVFSKKRAMSIWPAWFLVLPVPCAPWIAAHSKDKPISCVPIILVQQFAGLRPAVGWPKGPASSIKITEFKSYRNHPIAAATESCSRCRDQLCGMCVDLDNADFLRKLYSWLWKSEICQRSIDAESSHHPLQISPDEHIGHALARKNLTYPTQLIIIFVCTLANAVQLCFYNRPSGEPYDPLSNHHLNTIASLVNSLTVFGEMSLILNKEERPRTSLICKDSFEPNLREDDQDEIRIINQISRTMVTKPSM